MTRQDRQMLAHYTKISNIVSAADPSAGDKLAGVLTDVLGWCSDEEHADALRRLAIAMTEIAIEFRDRANDLDRLIIDGWGVRSNTLVSVSRALMCPCRGSLLTERGRRG